MKPVSTQVFPLDQKQSATTETQPESGFWRTARTNSKLRRHSPPIQVISRDQPLPLSYNQERLWSLEQLQPGSSVHNLLHTLHLSGVLAQNALQQTLQEIVDRHEILRTTFSMVDGQVAQTIIPEIKVDLPVIDLQHIPAEQQEQAVQELAIADAEQAFDLTHCPLWRFTLVQLSETEHVLIRTIHHIIFDGWSHTVFMREFGMLYAAFAAGEPSPLLEFRAQYADFAHTEREWLKDENLAMRLAYWQQQLGGTLNALELPIDRPHPALTTYQGACQSFELSEETTEGLKALSYQTGVSLFVTLLSSFNVLLHCYTQQTDLLVCSPVAGRHRTETKGLIGYFNNLLVMRSDLSGNPSFQEVLQRVSQMSLEAYEHQDTPLQKVAELPNLARIPLTRAMFVLQNTPNPSLELGDLTVTSRFVNRAIANFDLSLSMQEQDGCLTGALQYKTDLFSAESISQLTERFQHVVSHLVANPDLQLSDLPKFAASKPEISSSDVASVISIPYVAPRTIVERQLSQIWQELLEIQSISINANFFELGGYSLLAIRLFNQIEEVFGKALPLSTLVSAPTIEQLAAVIDGTEPKKSESIVLLKPGNTKPALFLLHDGDGEILLYRNLAHRLSGRAVYGVQPYSQAGYPILHTRVPEMAAYYVEQIRAVQPQGPYLLGGLCAGGVLAFEVASQLQQQGQQVAMVAIIDAADAKAAKQVGRITGKRLSSFSKAFAEGEPMPAHQRVLTILNKVRQKITNLISYEVNSRIQAARSQIQLKLFRYYLDKGLALPHFLRQIPVREVFMFAEQNYSPESLYNGELALFRATQKVLDFAETGIEDEPYINVYSDPLLGWGQRSTRSVQVYDIPGGHSSMLQEPNVAVMAEHMQQYIDLALSSAQNQDANQYEQVA